jgi:hypothetical protein
MPLLPIQPDPKASQAELATEIERWRGKIAPEVLARWARFHWECDRRKDYPDEFTWPFSNWLFACNPGFKYDEYLKSDLWHQIRKRVLVAAKHQCTVCSNSATQVHHRDYRPRVLRGEDDSPLAALCKRCHEQIHANDPSWQETERRLAELVDFKDSEAAKRAELTRPVIATTHGDAFIDFNRRNRERQREYRRVRKLGNGDITRGRAIEAEQRRSKMSPYDLGVEDAYSRLAALRTYNVRSPERCPFFEDSPEEAEYDRGWQDTMQKQRG